MMAYNHLAVENFHPKSHWLFLKDPLKMVSLVFSFVRVLCPCLLVSLCLGIEKYADLTRETSALIICDTGGVALVLESSS